MISFQIGDTVYATNNDLRGFFSRGEHVGAYQQHRDDSQIEFRNEREFKLFCRSWAAEKQEKVESAPGPCEEEK